MKEEDEVYSRVLFSSACEAGQSRSFASPPGTARAPTITYALDEAKGVGRPRISRRPSSKSINFLASRQDLRASQVRRGPSRSL